MSTILIYEISLSRISFVIKLCCSRAHRFTQMWNKQWVKSFNFIVLEEISVSVYEIINHYCSWTLRCIRIYIAVSAAFLSFSCSKVDLRVYYYREGFVRSRAYIDFTLSFNCLASRFVDARFTSETRQHTNEIDSPQASEDEAEIRICVILTGQVRVAG